MIAEYFSFAGKDTLRCLALALKRMPEGQQSLSYDDEENLTFIGLVCFVTPAGSAVSFVMVFYNFCSYDVPCFCSQVSIYVS